MKSVTMIPNEPSTSSGPLLLEDVVRSPSSSSQNRGERPLSPTIFTDGRKPVNISAKHLKDHPLHEPTGTSEVLTFYPTLEEFKDFKGYIRKIEKTGAHQKAGIAKIVAPEGWKSRPSKTDFSDTDNYEITQPAQEEIEAMEKKGAYFKKNFVCHRKMLVSDFRAKANSAQYRNPKPNLKGKDLEDYYFEHITEGRPIYGADTEGSFYDKDVKEWNMNNLGTILSDTEQHIKGVTTVYLYFGMYKTTFPWHAEDMDLYSINFLHFGSPKYWFAISSEHADRFERFMSQLFAAEGEYAPQCKAFLRHKTYLVTPELLRIAKIPYATMVQRPNEFIITFPRGYHMGFNTGYNLAESTNFATERWVDYGKDAVMCDCKKDTVKIDMTRFVMKYRPDEYATWFAYWYGGGRDDWVPMKKKEAGKRRRSGAPAPNAVAVSKRARFGGSADGTSSEGSSASETDVSAFLRAHPGYVIKNCENKPDYDELKRKYKKDTKLLRSDYKVDFFQERAYNQAKRAEWPHCAVCQYFQPSHMCAITQDIPSSSTRLIAPWNFSKKDPEQEEFTPVADRLLTCSNCHITVHSGCCSGDDPDGEWKCVRCRGRNDVEIRTTSCQLCELRGGVLIPCQIGKDSTWAHVICAIFSRRTVFDRGYGPTQCFVEPSSRQESSTVNMPELNEEYRSELGELYEDSRWECVVCHKIAEGLTPCEHCIQEQSTTMMPSVAHITCARRVGFLCENRNFPHSSVMICHKHDHSYLVNKAAQSFPNIKVGDEVFLKHEIGEDGRKTCQSGRIVRVDKKPTVVVDFYDSTCSRDNTEKDIQSCECLQCENGEHQYGTRVQVVWEDKEIYDAYYRGKGVMSEYTLHLEDGREVKSSRDKLMSKRERNQWLKM